MAKFSRTLVTNALPYANGSLHVGHLVGYVQADIFVRFLRLRGEEVVYVCADDTHGTPIEVNAAKQNISPEQLIARYYDEHRRDFSDFLIGFDNYYSTNSPENRHYSDLFFTTLKKRGFIYQKEVELTYCPHDGRFLPDRFVKGTCPRCGKEDQYGDVCEKCSATYKTIDLVRPYCVICHNPPERRKSTHYFFRLTSFSEKLRRWITRRKFQVEVKNYLLKWIEDGLEDWDITRDGPYFGFKIPGEENKYYYVWLDAPIGYIASTANYAGRAGKTAEYYWREKESRIIHFIGKDIIYFHFLFWPAMLSAARFNLPDRIHVNGFLTVNGEKMSKSRGTFMTAREFLDTYNPEHLRFYFASGLADSSADIDLNWDDFAARVNNELVSNIANFAYRVLRFINDNFDSVIGAPARPKIEKSLSLLFRKILRAYEALNYREAVKLILQVSDIGNRYFQKSEPWVLIRKDRASCEEIVAFSANIVRNLATLLFPILPNYSGQLWGQLNLPPQNFSSLDFTLHEHRIGQAGIIFTKIGIVQQEEFPLNLKIARIEEVSDHPNAEKLYILKINLGSERRQLVAGLKAHYTEEQLLGRNIVVIANLKHAVLRGVESQGMLLAADNGNEVKLLSAPNSAPGDSVFIEGLRNSASEIDIETFKRLGLVSDKGRAVYKGRRLKTPKEEISVEISDGAIIR